MSTSLVISRLERGVQRGGAPLPGAAGVSPALPILRAGGWAATTSAGANRSEKAPPRFRGGACFHVRLFLCSAKPIRPSTGRPMSCGIGVRRGAKPLAGGRGGVPRTSHFSGGRVGSDDLRGRQPKRKSAAPFPRRRPVPLFDCSPVRRSLYAHQLADQCHAESGCAEGRSPFAGGRGGVPRTSHSSGGRVGSDDLRGRQPKRKSAAPFPRRRPVPLFDCSPVRRSLYAHQLADQCHAESGCAEGRSPSPGAAGVSPALPISRAGGGQRPPRGRDCEAAEKRKTPPQFETAPCSLVRLFPCSAEPIRPSTGRPSRGGSRRRPTSAPSTSGGGSTAESCTPS